MKYLFILFLIVSTLLTAEEYPIMMQIKSEITIPEDFRGGIEEGLTDNGYSLVNEDDQLLTLKEQANQRKKECYDESCLVDVGKMLAAKGLVIVEVSKKINEDHLFKVKYVDFETGTAQKILTEYFKFELTNYEELNNFGKLLAQKLFGKNDSINSNAVNSENLKEVIIEYYEKLKDKEKYRVEFITIPEGVEVYDKNNKLIAETPFFANLPKDFYKFSFEKKGFDKVDKEIHIKKNESIQINMKEIVYYIKIETNAKSARVFIDGKEKGRTPFKRKLKEGIYKIEVKKEDYDDYSEKVILTENIYKKVNLRQNTFQFELTSKPSNSTVFIDGKERGLTPFMTKLKEGTYAIRAEKEDHYGYAEKILVNENISKLINFKKNIFEVELTSEPSNLKIFIDGKEKGTTPFKVILKDGFHKIKTEKDGYFTAEYDMKVSENMSRNIKLQRNIFDVSIGLTNGKGKVYIDGKYKGDTPLKLKLNHGNHSLKITNDYYFDYEEELFINDDAKLTRTMSKDSVRLRLKLDANTNADVYIDGYYEGKIPFNIILLKGTHDIELKQQGYENYETIISLERDDVYEYIDMDSNMFGIKAGTGISFYQTLTDASYSLNAGFFFKYNIGDLRLQSELLFINKNTDYNNSKLSQVSAEIPFIIGYNQRKNITFYTGLYLSEVFYINSDKGEKINNTDFVTTYGFLGGFDISFKKVLIDLRYSRDLKSVINIDEKDLFNQTVMFSIGYVF